jgi:hypothetical protein
LKRDSLCSTKKISIRGDISYNKKLDCYITKGNVILEDKSTLRITELPVGKWTQDYKELLDNMLTGKGTKSGQENILKNYTEHHTGKWDPFFVSKLSYGCI